MTAAEPDLSDLAKRIMIFLSLANDGKFYPDVSIIAHVLNERVDDVRGEMDYLRDIGWIHQRKVNDQIANQDGYRAYIPDTHQKQPAGDDCQ